MPKAFVGKIVRAVNTPQLVLLARRRAGLWHRGSVDDADHTAVTRIRREPTKQLSDQHGKPVAALSQTIQHSHIRDIDKPDRGPRWRQRQELFFLRGGVPHEQRGVVSRIRIIDGNAVRMHAELLEKFQHFYAAEPFVRICPEGRLPNIAYVRGSNYCDLGLVADPRTNRVIVVSAIDNLIGSAGTALIRAMRLAAGHSPSPAGRTAFDLGADALDDVFG